MRLELRDSTEPCKAGEAIPASAGLLGLVDARLLFAEAMRLLELERRSAKGSVGFDLGICAKNNAPSQYRRLLGWYARSIS